ncbi:MAG: D-inositol-3-phosphate glycosyltransferase [Holosporales bacterium]
MKKILHVISGKGLGGPKTVFLSYQSLLEDAGHTVIPAFRKNSKIGQILNHPDSVYLDYSRHISPQSQKKAMADLASVVDDLKIDIIIVHKPKDALIWRYACPTANIVLVRHGFKMDHVEHADHIIAVSSPVYNTLEELGYNNITLVNNFLKDPVCERAIDPQQPIVRIGAFGVFTNRKGFTDLIRALSHMNATHPFQLDIYGKGILKPILYFWKWLSPHRKQIAIKPWTTNPMEQMKNLDVVVVSSRKETFCMVIIEAMSQGPLVISTQCGGPETIITHEETGILVPARNPFALGKALEDAINHLPAYNDIRAQAKTIVAERYSKNAAKKELLSVIDRFFQQ